jgi:hypothetical protein
MLQCMLFMLQSMLQPGNWEPWAANTNTKPTASGTNTKKQEPSEGPAANERQMRAAADEGSGR